MMVAHAFGIWNYRQWMSEVDPRTISDWLAFLKVERSGDYRSDQQTIEEFAARARMLPRAE